MSIASRLGWGAFLGWQAARERGLPFAPDARIEEIRKARLRRMVRLAYLEIPYYREAMQAAGLTPEDFRSPDDLSLLPLLTKDQLLDSPGLCSPVAPQRGEGLEMQSSGTSGRSRTIFHDAESLFLNLAGGLRMRQAMAPFTGRVYGCREAVIARPGSVHEQVQRFYREHGPPVPSGTANGLSLNPAGRFDDELEALNRFRADTVRGYGSYLGSLFRWVHDSRKPFVRPKAIIYGADSMPDADRTLIQETMGLPVFATYQAVEALRIGYQCPLRQGLHVYADQVNVRVADRQGRILRAPATGNIVLANLVNRGTVLLNYKLGDVVTLTDEPCPCGRTGERILRIEGRDDDVIRRPDRTAIHALTLLAALQSLSGVMQVQVEQHDITRFTVRVVPGSGADRRNLALDIRAAMQTALGFESVIGIEAVERIQAAANGKVRAVISRVRQ